MTLWLRSVTGISGKKKTPSRSWREDSLKRNAEVQSKVRLHVVVRLATTRWGQCQRTHLYVVCRIRILRCINLASTQFLPCPPSVACGRCLIASSRPQQRAMSMSGHFRLQKGYVRGASGFAENMQAQAGALSRVHRGVSLKVGKSEIALAV